MEKKALGKGLSALIPDRMDKPQEKESENSSGETIVHLETVSILNNSLQPRLDYSEEGLEDLKVSILERGVLQPILVRFQNGHYEVVAGERRLRAAKSLGLKTVPAIVKELTDQETLVIALIENLQRQDLNAIEEAEAFRRLLEDFHYTQEKVAQAVGKDRATIANFLRLLKLPKDIQEMVAGQKLSAGHARTLLGFVTEEERRLWARRTIEKGLSVRELEEIVKKSREKKIKNPEQKQPEKDPDIRSLENDLQKILGTKVTVTAKKKKGKVIIEYYSLEDLDRIIHYLKKKS